MADRNRNGIDDDLEKRPVSTAPQQASGLAGLGQGILQGPVRGLVNFGGDIGRFLTSKPPTAPGGGLGDIVFGMPTRNTVSNPGARARLGGGAGVRAPQAAEPEPMQQPSLLDFLAQAEGLVDQLGIGGGGGGGVDYGGAMDQARSTHGENRAYLQAIYNQLRGGMTEDRGKITENTQGSIDRSQQIAQEAQQATQQAYDSAADAQAQEANALGMSAAQASINTERPGLRAQAADAISDSNARAQNAQTLYNTQGDNALRHNQNVQDASRFSEVRAQSALDASLAERLSELSQLQAQASAQAAAQGAGQRGSAIQGLAQYLYEDSRNTSQQDFENQLRVSGMQSDADLAREKLQAQQSRPSFNLAQLMQGQAQSGLDQKSYLDYMKLLASLND